MKNKKRLLDFGRSKYFHHRHGVVYLNKRSRFAALSSGIILALGGGFLITTQLVLPSARRLIALQKQHHVSVNAPVLAEAAPKGAIPDNATHKNELLSELVNQKIASYPKDQKWSVFMYDFKDGGTININQNEAMPAASLYKFFLLEALESKLSFDKWAYTWTSDGTNVQDCVLTMLQNTDSACAESLSGYIGWGVVDQLNQKNGFKNTNLDGVDGRVTSAADIGELLIKLKKGQMLSDKARRFIFDALYQQTNKVGISAGCNGCRAADKTGEMTGVANDAGIVTHGEHSYVLVVLSQGGSMKQIAELTKTIEEQ